MEEYKVIDTLLYEYAKLLDKSNKEYYSLYSLKTNQSNSLKDYMQYYIMSIFCIVSILLIIFTPAVEEYLLVVAFLNVLAFVFIILGMNSHRELKRVASSYNFSKGAIINREKSVRDLLLKYGYEAEKDYKNLVNEIALIEQTKGFTDVTDVLKIGVQAFIMPVAVVFITYYSQKCPFLLVLLGAFIVIAIAFEILFVLELCSEKNHRVVYSARQLKQDLIWMIHKIK